MWQAHWGHQRLPSRASSTEAYLDLLFTNKPALIKKVSVIPGLSDHSTVIIDTFLHIQSNKKTPRKINQWSRANWEEMKREVRDYQEQYLNTALSQSAEQRNQSLTEFITQLISKHVPQKLASICRNVPCMTRSLRRMCRKKQRLYNKASKKHSWQEFSFQRRTTAALRAARRDYINNILVESLETKDNNPFWRYIKSQRQEICGVAPLKADGQLHPDASKKAEILNQQFTSVFKSDDEDDFSGTVLEGPSIPPIGNIKVDERGVAKMLQNLDVKKASGPNELPCRLLKELANELAPIYTDVFQCSLDTGEQPSAWKTANVAPIYKKGPVCEAKNYRPVSLTCIPCKL